MAVGIRSIGFYVPHQKDLPDNDSLTMAVNASLDCLGAFDKSLIGACFFGSETHPYAVKASSAMLSSFLGLSDEIYAADLEFACKAGTTAMINVASLIEAGRIKSGLAVGSDLAKAEDGDPLSASVGEGAASVLLSTCDYFAEIVDYVSVASDTADFWRSQGAAHPVHAGRFTGEGGYYKFIEKAFNLIRDRNGFSVSDIDHVVLHMPNKKFPYRVLKRIGFDESVIESSFVFEKFGNTFSACSLIGLRACFEKVKSGDTVLMISYGSGSGSDAFLMKINDRISEFQNNLTSRIW